MITAQQAKELTKRSRYEKIDKFVISELSFLQQEIEHAAHDGLFEYKWKPSKQYEQIIFAKIFKQLEELGYEHTGYKGTHIITICWSK